MLTITYEKLLEIYFQNPQFGYYFWPDQPAPAGTHPRLEGIVVQQKAEQ